MLSSNGAFCFLSVALLGLSNAQLDTTTAVDTTSTIGLTTSTADALDSSTTAPEICEDDPTVDCKKLIPQCSDHRYDELMDKYCRKTCNRCGSVCSDTSKNCKLWKKNGFCDSNFYPIKVKKDMCKKTCDLC